LRGVAVHLGNFLVGEELGIPQVAGAFVEACAEKHQQVGVIDEVAVRLAIGRHAKAAQRQGCPLGHHALGLEAGGDRDVEVRGGDNVARARLDAAVAATITG
jgi:hypothetical protein